MKRCRACGYLDPEWEFCDECTKILVNFINGQRKIREDYEKYGRGV